MFLFTQPDNTKYPDNFVSTSCPGLEELTGCDLCIAKLPIPPTVNLDLHIQNHSLFVQLKIDGDNLSFDAIHRFVARVQAAKIPKNQAILLRIGKKWFDAFEKKDTTKYSETSWQAYRRSMMANGLRGITIHHEILQSIDSLQDWIDDYVAIIEKEEAEPKKEIYPVRPTFDTGDIWQNVEEIKDWRKVLVCGLDNFGSKRAMAVWQYLKEHHPKYANSFFFALCALTDEDDNGKALHNIPGIGDGLRKAYREQADILPGWNLAEQAWHFAYWEGWQSFGNNFLRMVNKEKKSPKDAHSELMKRDCIFKDEIPY